MGFGPNFDTNVGVDATQLVVHGNTPAYPDGGKLIARHIALEQDGDAIHAADPALDLDDWDLHVPLPAQGFRRGAASACGIEVVYYGRPGPNGRPPAFVALTWSQMVTIGAEVIKPDDLAEPQ